MVAHLQILKCAAVDRRKKWTMHWLLAFGCVLLVAIKFFFLRWFQTDKIYPLYHPQRWLGYLGAACLILGSGEILVAWFREREAAAPVQPAERSDFAGAAAADRASAAWRSTFSGIRDWP